MKNRVRSLILVLLFAAIAASTAHITRGANDSAAPRIIVSTPAQREVVEPNTGIKLSFDQPMDQASVASAWSVVPAVKGKLNWSDDSTLTFTPDSALKR